MAGLDPAIHETKGVDARHKAGMTEWGRSDEN
jgi:hypothetical protein